MKFFQEFKAAVAAGDKEKVASMTAFPFKDSNGEVYEKEPGGAKALSAKTKEQFLEKYDRLFDAVRKDAIAKGKGEPYVFYGGEGDPPTKMRGQYEIAGLIFKTVKGQLRLSEIPYKE